MPHELSSANGQVAFANSRDDAWHHLGQVVGHDMTAQEALEAAHLANWNVRKVPLWADISADFESGHVTSGSRGLKVEGQYGVVFDNHLTKRVQALHATVGERYEHAQNEDLAVFGEALVDELGQRNWQTAGSLRNFSQVFLTMLLPNTMELATKNGIDVTKYYLALLNSHDGSTALTGLITPVRIVCANTQNAAIRGAVSSFKIRHTANWRNALEEARRALGLAFKYEAAFEAEVARLYAQELSDNDALELAHDLVKLDQAEKSEHHLSAYVKREDTAKHIHKLFVSSPTIVDSIGGTRWGFYNAVTEYVDHFQGVRNANGNEANARAIRTITAAQSNVGLKSDAWKLLTN